MKFIPDNKKSTDEIKKFLKIVDINDIYDVPNEILKKEYIVKFINHIGLSEKEIQKYFSKIIDKNKNIEYYIGAGIYNHYIPAVVDEISSRSEFYTSYTPYQPEMSQGFLQAMFEFQSVIVKLSGMDVANASLYDGGTALVEAAYMCKNIKRKKKLILFDNINPLYLNVLNTYNIANKLDIKILHSKNGEIDLTELKNNLDDSVAGVVIQNPNFFGLFENSILKVKEIIQDKLLITIFNPLSVGVIKSPGEYDSDIVIGEAQNLGIYPNYGGPLLGIIATRKQFMRKLPGRIVGMTVDKNNKKGFTLTLQAREQHIRREKAISNICSNEALCALRATIYTSALGEAGFKNLSALLVDRAHKTAERITEKKIARIKFSDNFFNEFVLEFENKSERDNFKNFLKENNIFFGLDLENFIPDMNNSLLVAVTETNDIDYLFEVIDKWKK